MNAADRVAEAMRQLEQIDEPELSDATRNKIQDVEVRMTLVHRRIIAETTYDEEPRTFE